MPYIQQIQCKNGTFINKMPKIVPKPHYWVLLCVLWAQNPIFMSPINMKLCLSSKICIISNRSNVKMALLYNKCPQNPFVGAFIGFMGPKPYFYGYQKPQIEFYYVGPALYPADPMQTWHFIYKMSNKCCMCAVY